MRANGWVGQRSKIVEVTSVFDAGLTVPLGIARYLIEEMPKEADVSLYPFSSIPGAVNTEASRVRFMKLPPDVDNLHQFHRQHGEDAVHEAIANSTVVTMDWIRFVEIKMRKAGVA